jgi:hypothetical protein
LQHRSDSLSAAFRNLDRDAREDGRYAALCEPRVPTGQARGLKALGGQRRDMGLLSRGTASKSKLWRV